MTTKELIKHKTKQVGACEEVSNFIVAQAILESGNFTSNIFNENKNCFGMKLAKNRLTKAIGVNRNHAIFETISDCIDDYLLWLVYNGFTQHTMKNIILFKTRMANSGFNPHKDYINTIENIKI